jgi:signal transduction histidine kinase
LTLQEDVRRRIARGLHDDVGQCLAALGLELVAIAPLDTIDECAQQCLTELKKASRDLGSELNRVAWELYPLVLDDLGLRRAVAQYLEECGERTSLQIDLEMRLDDPELPRSLEITLFRTLRDLMRDILTRPDVRRVGVILEAANGVVQLIVEDDCSSGFNSGSSTHRIQLRNIRERLKVFGGSAELEAGVSSGTTVYVRAAFSGRFP